MKKGTTITAGYHSSTTSLFIFYSSISSSFLQLSSLSTHSSSARFTPLILDYLSFLCLEKLTLDSQSTLTEAIWVQWSSVAFWAPLPKHLQQLKALHSLSLNFTKLQYRCFYLYQEKKQFMMEMKFILFTESYSYFLICYSSNCSTLTLVYCMGLYSLLKDLSWLVLAKNEWLSILHWYFRSFDTNLIYSVLQCCFQVIVMCPYTKSNTEKSFHLPPTLVYVIKLTASHIN